jgi:transaldolase
MRIFLDTANVTELREGVAMGLVDGCTTNPSLIAREKRSVRPLLEEICAIVPGDVESRGGGGRFRRDDEGG